MLPYANITNIIDSLKSAGYLNSTSNVLSWISLFHNQSAIFLQDIVDKTSISIEDLTTFTTEVIPCITSLFFNDTLSEAEITNLINKDWYVISLHNIIILIFSVFVYKQE